ncbi:hypothetical protein ES703_116765 [subsurface metagenome]
MKRFILMSIIILMAISTGLAEEKITGQELIKKVQDNMYSDSVKYSAEMIITVGKKIRKKEFFGYGVGTDKSFMEFTSPSRDKGKRFLMIKDNMWIYDPIEDKSIKIPDSLLKGRSFMGSDFSYRDATDNPEPEKDYKSTIIGSEKINGRDCYIVDMQAVRKKVTYPKKKVWIDKEWFTMLKQNLYAKSGKLLKVMMFEDVKLVANRYYAHKIVLSNKLKKNSRTEMIMHEIDFSPDIPKNTFSLKGLKKS